MSATAQAFVAVLGMDLLARSSVDSRVAIAAPVAAVWAPVPTAALVGLWFSLRGVRSRAEARRRRSLVHADVAVLAEMCALGLASGHDFASSLRLASRSVTHELRSTVSGVLRRSRLSGLSSALASESGPCRDLFRLVSRAVDSGAPVRSAVEAFVDDAAADERARKPCRGSTASGEAPLSSCTTDPARLHGSHRRTGSSRLNPAIRFLKYPTPERGNT